MTVMAIVAAPAASVAGPTPTSAAEATGGFAAALDAAGKKAVRGSAAGDQDQETTQADSTQDDTSATSEALATLLALAPSNAPAVSDTVAADAPVSAQTAGAANRSAAPTPNPVTPLAQEAARPGKRTNVAVAARSQLPEITSAQSAASRAVATPSPAAAQATVAAAGTSPTPPLANLTTQAAAPTSATSPTPATMEVADGTAALPATMAGEQNPSPTATSPSTAGAATISSGPELSQDLPTAAPRPPAIRPASLTTPPTATAVQAAELAESASEPVQVTADHSPAVETSDRAMSPLFAPLVPAGPAAVTHLPTQAQTAQMAPVPVAQLPAQIVAAGVDRTGRLTLRLDPVELGPVQVTIARSPEGLHVTVRAEAVAHAHFTDLERSVRAQFANAGLDLSGFTLADSSSGSHQSRDEHGPGQDRHRGYPRQASTSPTHPAGTATSTSTNATSRDLWL